MKLNLIFAMTEDYLFGIDNRLPWKECKDDMQHFKAITTDIFKNKTVVMGKNTYNSLKSPLVDRNNIVISKTNGNFSSLEDFVLNYNVDSEVYIIGGKSLIEEALTKYKNIVNNVYINIVKVQVLEGDNKVYLDKTIIKSLHPYLKSTVEKNDCTMYKYTLDEHQENQYLKLLEKILKQGDYRQTRNANTYSIFSDKISFDLTKGFPLLTTKKMFMRGIFEELIFFIKGQTNSKVLEEKGVNIWKGNTSIDFIKKSNLPYEEGDMGPMYGFQWRHFNTAYENCNTDYRGKGVDQLSEVINLLITDPHSRRILLTDYNPCQSKQGVLYPCHSIIIQFYVTELEGNKMVSMNMYQRSVDSFLGLPFNITSNALLLHLLCETLNKITNNKLYKPYMLNIIMGDIHIYENHLDAVKTQLSRVPFDFPQIKLKESYDNLENYKWEDIEIINYQSHPTIKAEMVA